MLCFVFQELRLIFPNSQRLNRGNYVLSQLVHACKANEVTDLILVHEHRGEPGMFWRLHILKFCLNINGSLYYSSYSHYNVPTFDMSNNNNNNNCTVLLLYCNTVQFYCYYSKLVHNRKENSDCFLEQSEFCYTCMDR